VTFTFFGAVVDFFKNTAYTRPIQSTVIRSVETYLKNCRRSTHSPA